MRLTVAKRSRMNPGAKRMHHTPAGRLARLRLRRVEVHFLGYFAITLMFCLAWPRPFVVREALTAVGALLEGLQPWRSH